MQKIVEPIFHVLYLSTVLSLGYTMYYQNKKKSQLLYFQLFGIMAIVLGLGDAFHLIPRIVALLTNGLENHVFALGFGKLVTSVTMTIFYLMLYKVWKIRFHKNNKLLDMVMLILSTLRIILCLIPQNQWFSSQPPLLFGILRNIPFMIMGLLMIYLLYNESRKFNDSDYKKIALAVFLSFLFYTPVVILAQDIPLVGMFMIPKTIAYVWIVIIGYHQFKHSLAKINNAA